MEENTQKKIINNAISTYFLIFCSWLFLFNKSNKLINNDFVKNHIKSSMIIHFLIFLNVVIFLFYGFLDNFSIFWIWLNTIIADIIFFILLFFSIIWIYKALNNETFSIWKFIKTNDKNLLNIDKNSNFKEKDKLTLILSYIPFIWYILTSKYDKNKEILSNLRFNLFISLIISLIYIFYYNNLANLFVLIYTILVCFIAINLFFNSDLISFNLHKVFSPKEKIIYQKAFLEYIKKYLSGKFENFAVLKEKQDKKSLENLEKTKIEIQNLWELKWPKKIIYIPIINFIFLFFKENKYKFHIRNWLVLSFLLIFTYIFVYFNFINYRWLILFLFPISYGIWNLWKLYYKMPYIYEIFEFFEKIKNFITHSKKKIIETKNTTKEINLKVKEK